MASGLAMKQPSFHFNYKGNIITSQPQNPHNSSSDEWRGYGKVQSATLTLLDDGRISSHSEHRFEAENLRPNDVTFEIAYTHKLFRDFNQDEDDPDWRFEDEDNGHATIACAKGASLNYQKNFGQIENYRDVDPNKPGGLQGYKLETYTKVTPKDGFTANAEGVKAELITERYFN